MSSYLINYQNNGALYKNCALILLLSWFTAICLLVLHITQSNIKFDNAVKQFIKYPSLIPHKPIVLFLRPFITDGRLPIELNPLIDTLYTIFFFKLNKTSGFESTLRSTLKDKFTLIRLDDETRINFNTFRETYLRLLAQLRSLFSYRIGRYVPARLGQDWRDVFHWLAQQAFACLVVPPASMDSETRYEIEYLVSHGLWDKTIFIMPQSNFKIKRPDDKKLTAKRLWENMTAYFSEKIQLPSYNRFGGFVIPISGSFFQIAGIGGKRWYSKNSVKRIFKGGRLTDLPWQDSLRITRRLVWIIPIASFIISLTIGMVIHKGEPDLDDFLFIFTIIFAIGIIGYYEYCHYFLLSKKQIRILYTTTVAALFIGLAVGNSITNYLITIGWLPRMPSNLFDFSSLYILSVFLMFPSLIIYAIAYWVFSKRKDISFSMKAVTTPTFP